MVDADHLYAADGHWWHYHIHDINMGFAGKRWSCEPLDEGKKGNSNWNAHDPDEWGVTVLGCETRGRGLSDDPDVLIGGSNSGYQGIGLAHRLGATRIILLGFDMCNHSGLSHFFGDHPKEFANGKGPERFIAAFRSIKPERYGIEIINCSRHTALDAFPRHNLEDVF